MDKTYKILREQWKEWLTGGENNLADPNVARTIKFIKEKCDYYLETIEENENRNYIWKEIIGDNPFQESGKVTHTCKMQ